MDELLKRLNRIAYKKSKPFCYSCYVTVKGSHCRLCGSDDLMREDCNGVEWGTSHIIDTILSESDISTIDLDEAYDQMLDECYEEIKMGYNTWAPSDVLKNMSPGDYELGKGEYLHSLLDDEQALEINGKYYWEHDISKMVEELEQELGIEDGTAD